MSGLKELNLALGDWYKRRISEPMLRSLEPGVITMVHEQTREQLNRELGDLRGRQSEVEKTISELGEQNREFELETNRQLREHFEDIQHRMTTADQELRGELLQDLAESERSWRAEIDAERQQRQQETGDLANQITEIAGDRQRAVAIATERLRESGLLRDLISSQPHERYAPNRLTELNRRIAGALSDLQAGLPESAAATAQAAYHDLAALRVQIELQHGEWILLRSAATESLTVLTERIKMNTEAAVLGEEGQPLAEARFDVDHWADGGLGRLRNDVARTLATVQADDGPPDAQELREIIERQAPEYRERLNEVVDLARQRVLASQLRANVAQMVADALQDGFAYQTDEWAYDGADDRNTVYARLSHLNGNEIVVQVVPSGTDQLDGKLRIRSFDIDTESTDQRGERAMAISRYLRQNDLPVGELHESAEPEQREIPGRPGPGKFGQQGVTASRRPGLPTA